MCEGARVADSAGGVSNSLPRRSLVSVHTVASSWPPADRACWQRRLAARPPPSASGRSSHVPSFEKRQNFTLLVRVASVSLRASLGHRIISNVHLPCCVQGTFLNRLWYYLGKMAVIGTTCLLWGCFGFPFSKMTKTKTKPKKKKYLEAFFSLIFQRLSLHCLYPVTHPRAFYLWDFNRLNKLLDLCFKKRYIKISVTNLV